MNGNIKTIYGMDMEKSLDGDSSISYNSNANITNTITNNIKRKVQIPLLNNYLSTTQSVLYKVFQNKISDISTQMVTNSNFLQNTSFYLIIIKNTLKIRAAFEEIYNKFINMMLLILTCNFLLWYLILGLVFTLLLRETNKLTTPINNLIQKVTSIGKDEPTGTNKTDPSSSKKEPNGKNGEDTLEDLAYDDDQDIDDLFKICASLIRGGFSEEPKNLSVHYKYISNAYNNISYIKSNNLIIQEELIDQKNLTQTSTIFNYNGDNKSPKAFLRNSWLGSPLKLFKNDSMLPPDSSVNKINNANNINNIPSFNLDGPSPQPNSNELELINMNGKEDQKNNDNDKTNDNGSSPNGYNRLKDKLQAKVQILNDNNESVIQDNINSKNKKNRLISIKEAIKEEDRELIELVGLLNTEKTFLSEIFNSDELKVLDI